jgi:FMN phosphatase YigB (HAD superfamily)
MADFDIFKAYKRETGPLKMIDARSAFQALAQELGISPQAILVIGDTYHYDVLPALQAGMIGCLLCNQIPVGFTGLTASSTSQILTEVTEAIFKNLRAKEQI